jgi:hypothetical protein
MSELSRLIIITAGIDEYTFEDWLKVAVQGQNSTLSNREHLYFRYGMLVFHIFQFTVWRCTISGQAVEERMMHGSSKSCPFSSRRNSCSSCNLMHREVSTVDLGCAM